MSICGICGEEIPAGSRTCSMCGTGADDAFSAAPAPAMPAVDAPVSITLPPGGSYCPVCVRVYGPDYTDGFCSCGTELLKEVPSQADEIPMAPLFDEVPTAPILDDVPMAPFLDEAPSVDVSLVMEPLAEAKPAVVKPSPGTPCVVLFGPDKQPLQYFALEKDTTLIGRLDAVAGNFPDIDLDEWFDRATIRKISRQHALILRSRATRTFALRPLVGNTGTQLEGDMVAPQQDYPLRPGHRIILGGVIRLKFEIA